MLDEQPQAPDIQALLAKLHETVEERRRSGEYPPDLERNLAQHYQQILAGQGIGADRLERLLRNLDLATDLGPHRIETTSSFPMGSQVHKLIAKLVARQTEGILAQVAELAIATRAVVVELSEFQPPGALRMADITARIDDILDRLAAYERPGPDASPYVRELGARVERLEQLARGHAPGALPAVLREEAVGGPRSRVMEARRPLAARLSGSAPVVDIACGRGEMLELLREEGVEARGFDRDADLVEIARANGLDAEVGDGLRYLMALPDASAGGIIVGPTLGDPSAEEVFDAVKAARSRLREGGRLVVISANPEAVLAGAGAASGTARLAIGSGLLEALFSEAGFSRTDVQYLPHPSDRGGLEKVPPDGLAPEAVAVINRNIDKLEGALFGSREYAVLGTR
jgi:SAM-dependent methyltransferase